MYKNKFVVSVKVNDKFVREDNEALYLPVNSEYEIYLKNENTKDAIVTITLDGKQITKDNSILVKANTQQTIKTQYDSSNEKSYKLKIIKATETIKDHLGNVPQLGFLKVEYQFIKENVDEKWLKDLLDSIKYWKPYSYYPSYWPIRPRYHDYFNDYILDSPNRTGYSDNLLKSFCNYSNSNMDSCVSYSANTSGNIQANAVTIKGSEALPDQTFEI